MLAAALIIIGAYLVGSISFAVVVSRAFGLPDPHEYGSRNPGATNVLRTGNRKAALLTLAGLTVAVLMPLGMFYVKGPDLIAWAMMPIALLLFWRHRENIRQLVTGQERTIGQ